MIIINCHLDFDACSHNSAFFVVIKYLCARINIVHLLFVAVEVNVPSRVAKKVKVQAKFEHSLSKNVCGSTVLSTKKLI